MARYIDADKLVTRPNIGNNSSRTMWMNVERIVNEAPTADVVKVRHGKWIWKELYGEIGYMLVCSECEESEGACEKFDYCPNCGAKMDIN